MSSDELLEFVRELSETPYAFDFYAALRRFECADLSQPRLGRSTRPSQDPVRLGQEPTLAFAASQISHLEPARGNIPPRLAVFGPGLFGPNGPLPIHLTEYVRERIRNFDDDTMWRFVDLFHHRMLSLLYRAWGNAQPAVSADRPDDDRFAGYVASLVGMGLESLRDRSAVPDHAQLHYAGHFSRQVRTPQGLVTLLEDYFDIDVTLQEFVGEWLEIPSDGRWRLGERRPNAGLGLGTTIGTKVWGCQHRFRLVIGPMDFAAFQRFLPGEDTITRLVAMVRQFSGDEFEWDLLLVLKKDEVPALALGEQGALGRTSWLTDPNRCTDAADTRVRPISSLWSDHRAA